jgi:hypothetical protein
MSWCARTGRADAPQRAAIHDRQENVLKVLPRFAAGVLAGAAALGAALLAGSWPAPLSLQTPIAGAQGAPTAVQIEMGDYYSGAPGTRDYQITVPAGQVQFTFHNSAGRQHNFTIEALNQRIPDVGAGRTYEQTFTFTTPGQYQFFCDLPLHAQRGMMGTLTVTAAPAVGAAAPAPQPQPPAQPPAQTPAAGGSTATRAPAGTAAGGAAGGAAPAAGAAGAQAAAPAAAQGSVRNLPLLISLGVHIPSVIAWLGVVLYDAIVVAVPFLTPAQRGSLLHRPRRIILVSLPLFVITGIYQTINNPINRVVDIASLEELRTTTAYGFALFVKHGFVTASVVLTFAITFWFAPRLVAFADDVGEGAVTPSRLPVWLAVTNVASCVGLLLCVAVMVFQLH